MLYENTLLIKNSDKSENELTLKKQDIFRILFINHKEDYVIWIHIFDDSLPVQISLTDLTLLLSKEEFLIYTESDPFAEPPNMIIEDTDLVKTAKKKELRENLKNKHWNIIKDFIYDEPAIFFPKGRSKLFKQREKKSKNNKVYFFTYVTSDSCPEETSAKTFFKILKRYWKRGKTEFSLYDDYENCGTPKKPSLELGKKRGPKFDNDPDKGIVLTQKDKDNFKLYIEKEIIKNRKPILMTYRLLIESERYEFELDGSGSPVYEEIINETTGITELVKKPLPENRKPTEKQFTYYYYKHYSKEKREKNRIGDRTYLLTRRAITGTKRALFPGHMFEIDATVLDFYIRSHYPPFNLIGQPTFYVVIDVYSRFIIGWHMSVGNPSGANALAALVNMASDKSKLLKSIGYDDNDDFLKSDSHFSIKGIPKQLVIDQAELRKRVPEHIQKRFNIDIIHTPAKRPDWKGTVERRFDILQRWEAIYDPSHGNYAKKRYGDPDVRKSAIKTFDLLYCDFIDLIYLHNHSLIKNPRILSNLSLQDQVPPIPIQLFNHGIENVGGQIKALDEGTIRKNFLRTGQATITREGIKYRGLFFKPLIDGYEDLLSSSKKTQYEKKIVNNKVTILEHHAIVDSIYLPLDGYIDPIECVLLDKSDFKVQAELPEGMLKSTRNSIRGLCWSEFDDICSEYNTNFRKAQESEGKLQSDMDKRMTERSKTAEKETDILTSSMPQKEFLNGASERKQELKEEQDEQEAAAIQTAYQSPDQHNSDDGSFSDQEEDYSDLIDEFDDEMDQRDDE